MLEIYIAVILTTGRSVSNTSSRFRISSKSVMSLYAI